MVLVRSIFAPTLRCDDCITEDLQLFDPRSVRYGGSLSIAILFASAAIETVESVSPPRDVFSKIRTLENLVTIATLIPKKRSCRQDNNLPTGLRLRPIDRSLDSISRSESSTSGNRCPTTRQHVTS